jgi:hypothetical protein
MLVEWFKVYALSSNPSTAKKKKKKNKERKEKEKGMTRVENRADWGGVGEDQQAGRVKGVMRLGPKHWGQCASPRWVQVRWHSLGGVWLEEAGHWKDVLSPQLLPFFSSLIPGHQHALLHSGLK